MVPGIVHVMVRAPVLMFTIGPIIEIDAPLPLEMKMPASLTTMDAPVVLRGVVEYKYETVEGRQTFSLILHLASPMCVQGLIQGERPFKKENLTWVLLGLFAKTNKWLRDGESVTLRGAFWGPAQNDPNLELTFAVKEVM